MKRHYKLLGLAALFTFLADQLSKGLVVQHIPEYRTITVIPGFFDLINIRNRGAAFGFLNRSDIEWQFWLFLVATIIATFAIIFVARGLKEKATAMPLGLGLILGGAIGNLCDRLRMRAVIDFLDVYWRDWHWPAFNLADSAICVGAFLVCFLLCVTKKDAE